MPRVSAGHYVIGAEGLALLRSWLAGMEGGDRRVREISAFAAAPDEPPLSIQLDVPETDVLAGYARWASNYDVSPNALIALEEPVMRRLIDEAPPGVALDAACGTGRHTKHLVARGHRVIGVDASPDMLERAKREFGSVDFRQGALTALPVESGSVDLAVCALALSHCEDLDPPIRELARVLRPAGRLLISDLHPLMLALGFTAFFVAEDGSAACVRSFHHLHGAYLGAFEAAGLTVRGCEEPLTDAESVALMSGGLMHLAPEAFRTAFLGLPNALIWDLQRRPV